MKQRRMNSRFTGNEMKNIQGEKNMKNTSKFVKAVIAAASVVSLTACSASSAAASSTSAAKAQNVVIAISPDYPPFDSLTADGKLEGFDYDMGEWVFNWLNNNGYNYTHGTEGQARHPE